MVAPATNKPPSRDANVYEPAAVASCRLRTSRCSSRPAPPERWPRIAESRSSAGTSSWVAAGVWNPSQSCVSGRSRASTTVRGADCAGSMRRATGGSPLRSDANAAAILVFSAGASKSPTATSVRFCPP